MSEYVRINVFLDLDLFCTDIKNLYLNSIWRSNNAKDDNVNKFWPQFADS